MAPFINPADEKLVIALIKLHLGLLITTKITGGVASTAMRYVSQTDVRHGGWLPDQVQFPSWVQSRTDRTDSRSGDARYAQCAA
jgi:hypothetical protein